MGMIDKRLYHLLALFRSKTNRGGITINRDVTTTRSSSAKSNKIEGRLSLRTKSCATDLTYDEPALLDLHANWMTQVAQEMRRLASDMREEK